MVDYNIWQKELAHLNNVTFISYPELNNLFIAGNGKSTPNEYVDKQKHVALEVIQDITDWIKNQMQ